MLTEETTLQKSSTSKANFWKQHIENCNNSSLTQAQYCKENSLALATFCYWKKKLKMTRQSQARFYPLTVQSATPEKTAPSTAGISLHLCNNKYRIELAKNFSTSSLQKLIRTLEQI